MLFFNGSYYQEDDIKISPLLDSYMYGYGVYETLRTYNGKIFMLHDHVKRLFHSAELLDLKTEYSESDVMRYTEETFQKGSFVDARIKIVLTETELIIWPQPLNLRPQEWYETGIQVLSYEIQRTVPESKSLNCISYIMAQKYAQKNNVYETIFVDYSGTVREGSMSNIFWIKDNVLFTTKSQILKGITRKIVLKIAKEHMEVYEVDVPLPTLLNADECFLTNTTSNVLPIVQIDTQVIAKGGVGPHTKMLMQAFQEYLDNAQ